MEYHKTKNGTKIKLKDLKLSHLKNIIRWIDRKAAEGLIVRTGGGSTAEDMWYDEDTYYGEDARRHLNYYDYKAELSKRPSLT
jgi:hypothetical protein